MKKPWAQKRDTQPRRRQHSADQTAQQKAERGGTALFKRNRTLVGSLSASVSSASELQGDLRSPRAHVHHLTAHRRRLTSILFVVIALAGVLTWLLYEFTAGITVTPTVSSIVIQPDRYSRAINDYFGSHPTERLRFVMNDGQLTNYLHQTLPEVETVHVTGSAGFATSNFELTFRQPVAGWLIGSNQYYVDKDGVAFQQNYFDQPSVKIIDQSGVPQTAGTAVASGRFLRFVGRTVDLARIGGLTVEQAIIPSGTTRQVEVKVAGHPYPIKLSLDRSVGEQAEDMERAIAYFDSKQQSPQYIDVRVSGKAYYR
ncbi:MAG: hypothetical protein JWN75_417 [Candidatus Saccharibacteria bacterium]|nr:hypothetical protein [Candidatus Saccharibacteria bacterium]